MFNWAFLERQCSGMRPPINTSGKFNQSGIKKFILDNFWLKKLYFEIFNRSFSQKNLHRNSRQYFLSLKTKLTVLLLTIFTYFSKVYKFLGKNSRKCEIFNRSFSQKNLHQNSRQYFLSLKTKLTVLSLTIFTYFSKVYKILGKNSRK